MDLAAQVLERIEALGRISELADCLYRPFASPAMRHANDLVQSWMQQAGMKVRKDAVGNLIGHFPGTQPNSKILLLGSHLDTVRNAGKFDGPLGVILAIACIEQIREGKKALPFAIEIIAFADEEGARYQTAYLGSKAVIGELKEGDLALCDATGTTMAEAIRQFGGDPTRLQHCQMATENLLGYVEVHMEQGPVLEQKNLAVGVVTAIAGQTRMSITLAGRAGHAGTTPMDLRRDALCAAAEFILQVEKYARRHSGLVATVGQITAAPNVGNVIPGLCRLSLDVRHQKNAVRVKAVNHFIATLVKIGSERQVEGFPETVQKTDSVPCSARLSARLRDAVLKHQATVIELPSGAGHDAAIMARITPMGMLFVRCAGGISHHPDESVREDDIRVALAVLTEFVNSLGAR